MTFTITTATLEDADAIAKVHVQGWQEAYRGIFPDDFLDSLDQEERAKGWRDRMVESSHYTLVAKVDNEIVGFCDFGPTVHDAETGAMGEIYALYVLQAHYGQGIGSALITQAVTMLAQESLTPIQVICHAKNTRASGFYQCKGARFLKYIQRTLAGGEHLENVFVLKEK